MVGGWAGRLVFEGWIHPPTHPPMGVWRHRGMDGGMETWRHGWKDGGLEACFHPCMEGGMETMEDGGSTAASRPRKVETTMSVELGDKAHLRQGEQTCRKRKKSSDADM